MKPQKKVKWQSSCTHIELHHSWTVLPLYRLTEIRSQQLWVEMSLLLQGRSAEMLSQVTSRHLFQEQEAIYPVCLHTFLSCRPSETQKSSLLMIIRDSVMIKQKQMLDYTISFCSSPTSIPSGWVTAVCCINWFMMVKAPFCTQESDFLFFFLSEHISVTNTAHCLTPTNTTLERTKCWWRSKLLPFGLCTNSAANLLTTLCKMPLVIT